MWSKIHGALLGIALLRGLKSILALLATVLRLRFDAPGAGPRPFAASCAAIAPILPFAQLARDWALLNLACLRSLKITARLTSIHRVGCYCPGAGPRASAAGCAASAPGVPVAQLAIDGAILEVAASLLMMLIFVARLAAIFRFLLHVSG